VVGVMEAIFGKRAGFQLGKKLFVYHGCEWRGITAKADAAQTVYISPCSA
jgi:hypothetical protein